MGYREGTVVTYNHHQRVEGSLPLVRRISEENNVVSYAPKMGAEDSSYCQKVIPCFYFMLGVGN